MNIRPLASAIAASLLLFACGEQEPGAAGSRDPIVRPERPITAPAQLEVEIFFATSGGGLTTEKRLFEATERSIEEQISLLVETLLAGPEQESLVAPFPDQTSLRAVFVVDNIAVVDLGGATLRDWSTGTTAEMAAAYSLINTITGNLPEIESVQILVEGREVETLAGHLDLSRPLRPMNL